MAPKTWAPEDRPLFLDEALAAQQQQQQPTNITKHFSCVFHVAGDGRTLLGHKKTSSEFSCVGKVDGFGGRVVPGEHPRDSALRCWDAETGTTGRADTLQPVGEVIVVLKGQQPQTEVWHNHIFLIGGFAGPPRETSAMAPQWYGIEEVPYQRMWADLAHWLPRALAWRAGRPRFRGLYALEGGECVWGSLEDMHD
ncbi:Nudix (Nucleoside diphosphate linked moiety X)-type motif 1 [Pleodorina starrii]|uniref:Nudix (Nucleoside diphosphate linked moiety X)-type motif 1 n=1 Tax=Pleodorina starrii TaxID=330485 RepID=A0A9W6BF41_9CHLO|nr:Nudix (Nucleoside diphosphate linked moiety X)-type motif 1 [Pleodorina starrii]GLC51002.1 Nudix (Nucleoside diphosphate linked moiety X)-type motif 1 [Pleodorina starrii]